MVLQCSYCSAVINIQIQGEKNLFFFLFYLFIGNINEPSLFICRISSINKSLFWLAGWWMCLALALMYHLLKNANMSLAPSLISCFIINMGREEPGTRERRVLPSFTQWLLHSAPSLNSPGFVLWFNKWPVDMEGMVGFRNEAEERMDMVAIIKNIWSLKY